MKLTNFFEKSGGWVVHHRKAILRITAVLTCISVGLVTRLGVETDIAQLLPEDNLVAQNFKRISDDFETTSILVALLEGPDREALITAATAFEKALLTDELTKPLIRSIESETDREFLDTWGLLLQDTADLEDNERLFRSTRLLPLIRTTNDLIEEKLAEGMDDDLEGANGEQETYQTLSRFSLFSGKLATALQSGKDDSSSALVDSWLYGDTFMIDPDETTLIMLIRPNFTLGDREKLFSLSENTRRVGRETEALLDRYGTTGISFSFTGDVENEADEERAISSDIFYPTFLALGLIVLLFLVSMSRKRSILFALLALITGILIDLAFASVTVHKLNMITSSFGALLVGLGIDFGVHIVSRFDEERSTGKTIEESMRAVFAHVAAPIIIGGGTTAIAFYSLMLSRTLAFRQFGLIAGTGICTTLAAAFLVLPALLSTFPGKQGGKGKQALLSYSGLNRLIQTTRRKPVFTLGIFVLAAAVSVFFVSANSFEYDMRKIGPQGTAAKNTEDKVAERFGISTWQHMAYAESLEEVRALSDKLADAPLVSRTESLADYIPSPDEQNSRLTLIGRIRNQKNRSLIPAGGTDTTDTYWNRERVEELSQEFQRLEWNCIEIGDLSATVLGEKSLPVRKRNAMIREIFGSDTGNPGKEVFLRVRTALEEIIRESRYAELETLDASFARELDKSITRMAEVTRPITIADIPDNIRNDLVTPDGKEFLAYIIPDPALESGESFITFTDGLKAATDRATGTLALGVELSREVLGEAYNVGFVVAVIVILFVLLLFRSVSKTIVCTVPLACGMLLMFALYPFLGQFNIVNVLAIPLIIGTGIDYCVHIATAFKVDDPDNDSFRKTLKAVTLSALTTGFGFGSLALAGQFKGIADLGATLFLGITCSYFAAVFMVPAAMQLVRNTTQKESL